MKVGGQKDVRWEMVAEVGDAGHRERVLEMFAIL